MIAPIFASAQDAPPSTRHASNEQAIRQLQDEWLKAYNAGDRKTLDRIEGDDFTVAGEFGESSTQQQLDRVQRRAEKAQAVTRKIENQQFRFYGDVALVTETDRSSSAGDADDYRSTELWARRGGAWKVVHLHFTGLAKKP